MEQTKKKENHTLQGFLNFSQILKNLKKALSLAFRYDKKNLVVILLMVTFGATISYFQNGLFGKLIDSTIAYRDTGLGLNSIFYTVTFLILFTALPNVLSLIENFADTNFRFNFLRNLDLYFLRKNSSLDIATIESADYLELSQKASERGTMSIYNFIWQCIENYSNLIGVIVSFVILALIDRTLLLYAFLGSLPALYVQVRYGRDIFWVWDLNSSNRRKYFNRRSHFAGTISLTEMKMFQLANYFLSQIKKLHESFDKELKDTERNKLGWEIFALSIFGIFLGLSIWRIVSLALTGFIPIGKMLFAYTTYRGFKGTLAVFFRKVGLMSEFSNYAGYLFEIDELPSKIVDNKNAKELKFENKPPKIEFKNVSFRYSDQNENYALKDLSFEIESGQKVAIVGLSGAGKTTLIKILCRVYDPESGHVLVDGTDLKDIKLDSWQKSLGVLFQDFASYEFRVKEAIAIGNTEKELDENKVIDAAKKAKADGFIERLPKKYEQLLWKGFEDGVELSKGERQRMALARVMYRESPITILDEPTASVDALAEQEIFETLENLPSDKTVILISHRFSTVKNADKILVIEHGKLIEEGRHSELMKNNGKYAELYKVQAESYK